MRQFRMIHLADRTSENSYRVNEIHDEPGYRRIASLLADQYEPANFAPLIEVADVDLFGSRKMLVSHEVRHGIRLDPRSTQRTLRHLQTLWGYEVCLQERDAETERVLTEHVPA
jgi:stage V sporulation protein R